MAQIYLELPLILKKIKFSRFYYTSVSEMIMDKDQAETARVVNGIVEREIQSDIDDLRKKIKLTEAENEQKQEKV